VPSLNVASLSLGRGSGSIGLSVFSPLAIITLLYPEGRVKLLGRSVELFWASGGWVYLIALLQCMFSLLLALFLLRKTEEVMHSRG
jgi:hypothetical protein